MARLSCAYRNWTSVLGLAAAFSVCAACGSAAAPPHIDLVRELGAAERRAPAPVDAAIRVDLVSYEGRARPAIVLDAPARVTWTSRLPEGARFRAVAGLIPDDSGAPHRGVTIRVGISDNRTYEELARLLVTPSWQVVDLDLSPYTGWRFSLFYQPNRISWKIILNADATPGGRVAWIEPIIAPASPSGRQRQD